MSAFAKLPETETEPFLAPKRKAVTDTSLPAGVSHIWVLKGAPDSSIHLLIQQEYKDALVAILTWMKKINERAEYEDSSSLRDETKAVDVDSDRFYLKNTKQSSKATANEDKDGLTGRVARAERIGEDNENSSEDDDPVPIPLTHTPAEGGDSSDPLNEDDVVSPTETDSIPLERTTLLSSLDKFPNPFKDFGSISIDNGLVITGSSGIGKSYFLFLVLHLRRAKNLPTLYVRSSTFARFWKDGKEWTLNLDQSRSIDLKKLLPNQTWALFDFSSSLQHIPPVLTEIECFILQASSPKSNWTSENVHYFVMRPWSSSELISGLHLQKKETTSKVNATQLTRFVERYGGSARDAYFYASTPSDYEDILESALSQISSHSIDIIDTSINKIISPTQPSSLPFLPADVGHSLLSVFPVSDNDRRKWYVTSPTKLILSKLASLYHRDVNLGVVRMYEVCMRTNTYGSKMLASDLIDTHFHGFISAGGAWPLYEMAPRANTKGSPDRVWHSQKNISSFLNIATTVNIEKTSGSKQPQGKARPETRSFSSNDKTLRPGVGIYYKPLNRNFPTIDSFFVDRPGHAITFQMSLLSNEPHSFSKVGRDWLADHEITNFTYIFITPPDYKARLHVPSEIEKGFQGTDVDGIFHMILDFKQVAYRLEEDARSRDQDALERPGGAGAAPPAGPDGEASTSTSKKRKRSP